MMAVYLVFTFVTCLICYFSYYLYFKNRNYWKSRHVPYAEPFPLFGNYKDWILLKRHISEIYTELFQRFPNEPYAGTLFGTSPALVIQDPDLLKLIMSKEFYYFSGRDASEHNHKEPFMKNLVMAHGDEWKVLRTNMTQLFSSVKLKNMFYLIKNCSDTFEVALANEVETNANIETESLISKYTMDCITSCVFGVCSDTMKTGTEKNPFNNIGKKFINMSTIGALKNMLRTLWPTLFYMLGLKLLSDDVGMFFNKLISGVIKNREKTKISRNDIVDLILSWKRNNSITGDSIANAKFGDNTIVSIPVNDDLLIAQCEIFFVAGFETTAATTSFLLYELSKNKLAQNKVIDEVDGYLSKHDTIGYECINTMAYTEACIKECLRLHPVFSIITREVMHDYTLPTGLRLEKGTRIHIPVHHVQHRPDNFPDPETFRPERFIGEEIKNIKPYTYLPFGDGPRICIGMRFAKMAIYAALLKIFKIYKVELAEDMPLKLSYDPKAVLVSRAISGISLNFIPRKV